MVIEELKQHLISPKSDKWKNLEIIKELKDKREKDRTYYAGEQLTALKSYLDEQAFVIVSVREGDYQGEYYAIILCENKYWLWRCGFGSCSGCDSLENLNTEQGFDYIMDTMSGVKEFNNETDLINYLEHPRDYLYDSNSAKELKSLFIDYIKLKGKLRESGGNS